MKNVLLLVVVISLLGGNLLYSKDSAVTSSQFLEASPMTKMKAELTMALQQSDSSQLKIRPYASHPDYILPKKVLLFSALIPGAGELYCKSYWRSLLFAGIEATAWTVYFMYRKKGEDKEIEFQEFADDPETGWDYQKYYDWYQNLEDKDQAKFSHSLPGIELYDENDTNNDPYDIVDKDARPEKTQQYYEMIGKYEQFLEGWDNNTQIRDQYMDMRHNSNQLFETATNGAYVAMFNHILSAIDAAWVAKIHNKTLITSELKFENKYINYKHYAMLSLQLSW